MALKSKTGALNNGPHERKIPLVNRCIGTRAAPQQAAIRGGSTAKSRAPHMYVPAPQAARVSDSFLTGF